MVLNIYGRTYDSFTDLLIKGASQTCLNYAKRKVGALTLSDRSLEKWKYQSEAMDTTDQAFLHQNLNKVKWITLVSTFLGAGVCFMQRMLFKPDLVLI